MRCYICNTDIDNPQTDPHDRTQIAPCHRCLESSDLHFKEVKIEEGELEHEFEDEDFLYWR